MNLFDAISANKRNSIILMLSVIFLISLIIAIFSYALGLDEFGLTGGIIFALAYVIINYFYAGSIILSLSSAKPVKKTEYPYLYNLVEGLALAAEIPKPKLYMINEAGMNAFATGRDPKHAVIVVTKGLVENMNRQELEGVIAHEMSHIMNYDIRFMMLSVVLVGLIGMLSEVFLRSLFWGGGRRKGSGNAVLLLIAVVLSILAPIFAIIIRFAISRQREYLADASAARLTRYPPGLASALKKIKAHYKPIKAANSETAPLYIVNPIKKGIAGMFATHPPIEDRIKKLEQM
ncbi:M48 family metalloprotease [Candidatus Micrarchaeota archaeon]|nr:M48 family metalloprotease [Candidatus Micrarchaeota archaeon]